MASSKRTKMGVWRDRRLFHVSQVL
ncbi:hypothetical protein NC652_025726 [Populus alba x Populus x berolinensis]|nr:hypothetical protein NC651_024628 [Populus alba x Populus x berolinensis]KAJ6899337.1 hypothetical protein NC652_025726 [Populus alba x Populus x berolinensis]